MKNVGNKRLHTPCVYLAFEYIKLCTKDFMLMCTNKVASKLIVVQCA